MYLISRKVVLRAASFKRNSYKIDYVRLLKKKGSVRLGSECGSASDSALHLHLYSEMLAVLSMSRVCLHL